MNNFCLLKYGPWGLVTSPRRSVRGNDKSSLYVIPFTCMRFPSVHSEARPQRNPPFHSMNPFALNEPRCTPDRPSVRPRGCPSTPRG